jgi:uncharacterized protein (DUF2236 family)
MFDPHDRFISLSSDVENEKFRANIAESERDKLYEALSETVKLLEASLFITPDNSVAFKAKIASFKNLLNTMKK